MRRCGRTQPSEARDPTCTRPDDTPSLALPNCTITFDPSKCNKTAGTCVKDQYAPTYCDG